MSVCDNAASSEKTRHVQKKGGQPGHPVVPVLMYFLLAVPVGFNLVTTAL